MQNDKVNGYWMCDKGRDIYKFTNLDARLTTAKVGSKDHWQQLDAGAVAKDTGAKLREAIRVGGAEKVALVVTGQYTNEDYDALFQFFASGLGVRNIYHWVNNPEDMNGFDGLLFRGDRNPNTKGLATRLEKLAIKTKWLDFEGKINSGAFTHVVVAGPENLSVFPDLEIKLRLFTQIPNLIWLSAGNSAAVDQSPTNTVQIPMKTFIERDGTYTNFAGLEQKVKRGTTIVAGALTLEEAVHLMSGEELDMNLRPVPPHHLKTNFLIHEGGAL